MKTEVHNTQVQIQAYNLVDFVLAVQEHAGKGYRMNPELNEHCPQMLGPGMFICGMSSEQEVTDVDIIVEEYVEEINNQVEAPIDPVEVHSSQTEVAQEEVLSEEIVASAVESLEKNGTELSDVELADVNDIVIKKGKKSGK